MSQEFFALIHDAEVCHVLPAATAEALPGVPWGRFDNIFTPAFWFCRYLYAQSMQLNLHFCIGRSVAEEVAACILGGFGMPAEVGLAAFAKMKHAGVFGRSGNMEVELETLLSEPLEVGGRVMRYRYPRQRARYLASALNRLEHESAPEDDLELRNWLLTFDGIGPKTAAWITRNLTASDRVAIIDIHVLRAGVLAGVFPPSWTPERHYLRLEERFLAFANGIGVKASRLDAVIWQEMRFLSNFACEILSKKFRS